jgi:hypothetical protein
MPEAVLCLAQSKGTGARMKTLTDFLSLRPIWTRRGFEVIWYAYLVATLLRVGFQFNFLFSKNVTVTSEYAFALIYTNLFALAQLALVRIFLELALEFLITTREEAYAKRP